MSLSTSAVPAFGAEFRLCSDASGSNPTAIAEIKDFNRKRSFTSQESTTHGTATPDRTHIITLKGHSFTLTLNAVGDDPTHDYLTGLEYVAENRQERTYEIVPSDGTPAYRFNALITDIDDAYPVDGIRTWNVTFIGTGILTRFTA